MNAGRGKRILAGLAAAAATVAVSAPSASAQTLQRQLLCDDAEPNAIGALLPVGCENGVYDPETETYAPYDPATDDNGLLGLNNTVGIDLLGL